ncbi:hypothetical protein [Plastoroseomonas arctica]|uniref:Uncharacterized protein n=1 Tax=Plastoroseomonas arctica TaxID=1509237 RepID=A0AAF1JYK6_9PROT|nr:hypothetical protein [Plastoroseomonas arctica]MBR0657092.1 hypothetical protein [Plastoroseomonas arctica]
MHSIGIPLTYRRLPEQEVDTPWTEAEPAAPAIAVIAGVALSLVMIAVAAFLV